MSDIKEAVIKILEILSTADPVNEAINIEGEAVTAQYVIDSNEVGECKKLLERIDPGNQQLRINKPSMADHPNKDIKALYMDLLLCVESKYDNETRHETAKRLIVNAQKSSHGCDNNTP